MAAQAYDDIVRLLARLSTLEKVRLVEHLAGDVERELRSGESLPEADLAGAEAWQRFLEAGQAVGSGWTSELSTTELLSSMRR